MSFAELAQLAHRERVDLGARGFYATPDIDFDRETGRGTPFYYFTNGCAAAQVLIDRLTGELRVERLDVLMDAGRMIHHEIERGQVIGGLVQGIGWVTTEELVYGEKGELLSPSPTTYKVPNVTDLPADFRVAFVDNDRNRHNLRSTKAVGEPPLMLGIAVWAAIHHALSRVEPGAVPGLRLPATHEEILGSLARLEARAGVSPVEQPPGAVA
jgi:xanthine dehydrogenase large subunit